MREIKFRFFYKNKRIEDALSLKEIGDRSSFHWADDVIVVQYIDRKDKNGIEIYEGDITSEGIVEWCECLTWDGGGSKHPGFYFRDKYDMGDYGELNYHVGFDEDIEVIGNIYENLKLLT